MKNIKTLFKVLILVLAITNSNRVFAQHNTEKPDYSKYPYWIKMIDDSTTNYFEAINAYDTFWKNHVKPEEDEDLMTKGVEKVKEHHRKLSKREKKRQLEEDKFVYECKRFEHWKNEVSPYVQEDGSILTNYQRLELWKKQVIERDSK